MANTSEAEVRKAAEAQGYKLEKSDAGYRMVAENGTLVAGDWAQPDAEYFGLSLDQIADALEQQ